MTKYEVTYMVDPGDGIESRDVFEHESDDMLEALSDWWNIEGHIEFFITKCEIVEHGLMV